MPAKSLTPDEKAALVILSLGEELATQIFSKLERAEAQRIAMRLQQLGRVDQTQVDAALKEFLELLHTPKSKRLDDPQDLAKRLVQRSLQGDATEKLLASLSHVRMRVFERASVEVLGRILVNEVPQTVALVMAHAPAPQAGQLLRQFPESMRTEILLRVARLQPVDPEVLQDIDDHLIAKAARVAPKQKVGGARKVAELLNSLDQDGLHILQKMQERDPRLAETIRDEMFTFEDLVKLDNRGVQDLAKVVKRETLLLALRGASPSLFKLFLMNMSERSAKIFQDDYEALGPQKAVDVKAARQSILEIVRKLIEDGKLSIDTNQQKVV